MIRPSSKGRTPTLAIALRDNDGPITTARARRGVAVHVEPSSKVAEPKLTGSRKKRRPWGSGAGRFRALLDRLAPLWEHGVPSVDARSAVIGAFAATMRALGPANFIYTEGDAVFAHGHRRKNDSGEIRAPGLHFVCRTCTADFDSAALAGVSLDHGAEQQVAVVASVPLSDERWQAIGEGELVVLRQGRVVV